MTGATTVLDGRIVVEAVAVGSSTRVAQLTSLVEKAQLEKSNIQKLADRISAVFIPIVVVIAILTVIAWVISGAPLDAGFTAAVAVLVIACPCALGLATPVALMVGTGRAAQLGIILSGPNAIEQSGKIKTVFIDKTGTLTTGKMTVQSFTSVTPHSETELVALAAAVEEGSEHPVARAITEYAQPSNAHTYIAKDFHTHAGLGITASVDNKSVALGTKEFLTQEGYSLGKDSHDIFHDVVTPGSTQVFIGVEGKLAGAFVIRDSLKPDSLAGVNKLKNLGVRPVLLSGDNLATATHVAQAVGIDQVIAEATPEKKLAVIAHEQQTTAVAMIGDGINDAAALAQSNVGIAMGTGTDLAQAASDITLLRGTLTAAADALLLARKTLGIIRGNLFWAFAYNVAAIPLAALGFLNPMLAGAAMAFSSLFVVLNSLRLRHVTPA